MHKKGRKPMLPKELYPNHLMNREQMAKDLFKKKYSELDAEQKRWVRFHMKYDRLFSKREIRWLVKMARLPM